MNDTELTRALERGEIGPGDFRHAHHLHAAWVYLAESKSLEEAAGRMSATLRALTARCGHPEKYHETITRFWIHLLNRVRLAAHDRTLEEVVDRHPQLLEKNFPLVYYSRDLLFSERARTSWVEPDLKPFSIDAFAACSSSSPGDPPDRSLSR